MAMLNPNEKLENVPSPSSPVIPVQSLRHRALLTPPQDPPSQTEGGAPSACLYFRGILSKCYPLLRSLMSRKNKMVRATRLVKLSATDEGIQGKEIPDALPNDCICHRAVECLRARSRWCSNTP